MKIEQIAEIVENPMDNTFQSASWKLGDLVKKLWRKAALEEWETDQANARQAAEEYR